MRSINGSREHIPKRASYHRTPQVGADGSIAAQYIVIDHRIGEVTRQRQGPRCSSYGLSVTTMAYAMAVPRYTAALCRRHCSIARRTASSSAKHVFRNTWDSIGR